MSRPVALSLVAALLTAPGARAQTAPPRVARIEIGRDTVRFVIEDDGLVARYGYVRATGEWVEMERPAERWHRRLPASPDKPARLGGGFALVEHRRTYPGGGWSATHALRAADGHEYPIQPIVDSATLRGILDYTHDREANVASGFSYFTPTARAWRWAADTLWLANGGNWAALLRFDSASRTMHTFTAPWVANALVNELAVTRRAVWLAMEHASGAFPLALARFDRATHQWTRLTPSTSALPDSDIVAMDGAGDTLWIAAGDALAMYDEAHDRWDVRWFRAMPVIEESHTERFGQEHTDTVLSTRWDLMREPDPHERATRAIIDVARFLENVSPTDEDRRLPTDSFLAVARTLPPEHFERAWGRSVRSGGRWFPDLSLALADPRLVPFMLYDTARASRLPTRDELRAFGLIGDRRWLPYVQWLLDTPSGDSQLDGIAAWTRARLGDSSWLPLMRDAAAQHGFSETRNWLADQLAELGDTLIVETMLARVRREHAPWPYEWVREHVRRERWLSLVREAAETPGLDLAMMYYFYEYAPDSLRDDPETKPQLSRMVRAALAPGALDSLPENDAYWMRRAAIWLTSRTRDSAAVPLVIDAISLDSATYEIASTALVRLTGATTAPAASGAAASDRLAAHTFWARWWVEHRATFVPAARAAGDAAEAQWWRRRGRR